MILSYVIVLTVLAGAVFIISAPLRAARGEVESEEQAARIAELEAARDAKYHEIRDAELDLRTGKLSDEDYEAVDQALRAEAVEIMHALDAAAPAGAGIRAGE
jgi:flagellar biosynthesis/type III secretory pathway M-ring protein FliF/YscJ